MIVNFPKRRNNFVPFNMSRTWRSAIIFASMKVEYLRPCVSDSSGNVLFLDVHVEGVQQKPNIGSTDTAYELESLLHGVDQIGFKAVQWLNSKPHPVLGCVVGKRLQRFYRKIPLFGPLIG